MIFATKDEEIIALRSALREAYTLIKDLRDNPPPQDNYARFVHETCPLLNLPSAEDVRRAWNA